MNIDDSRKLRGTMGVCEKDMLGSDVAQHYSIIILHPQSALLRSSLCTIEALSFLVWSYTHSLSSQLNL